MSPDITVVVPYHNEKAHISYTLERVGEQTLPAKQTIFVNSSSTDDTSAVVDDWIRQNQHRFTTKFINVFANTDNPASSKNAGICRATTEWVAFMDCGQNFGKTWLEQQFQMAQEKGLDVVSGVVQLAGENWVDRCAVAQTYGFRRNRPCVPTTLAKKAIFDKTGLFLEGRRAGYDVAWVIKLRKLGIERGINENVKIAYIGVNFAANLASLYRKSILYAKPCVGMEGYWAPYLYIFLPPVFIALAYAVPRIAVALFLLYLVARTFILPIMKSRGGAFYAEHPFEAFFGLGLVGFIMDSGKTVGTWLGVYHYYLKSQSAGR